MGRAVRRDGRVQLSDIPLERQLSEAMAQLPEHERRDLALVSSMLQDIIKIAVDGSSDEAGLRLLRLLAHYAASVVYRRYGKHEWQHLLLSLLEMEDTLDALP
jgi:hypothetical protein